MAQTSEGIQRIVDIHHPGKKEENYKDVQNSSTEEIREIITNNDYVTVTVESNDVPFKKKMNELTDKLYKQIKESNELDEAIKANLEELGYGE
ncbi:hypothetical protein ACJDU8_19105 [Clostridium sp. WILCCON 0269]|uniref:DNA methylase adenine-specific domain-containing protein n=1 Tax=Candidatus Clostridium eludens TaxID=3381663 RepID=A0ABW8SPP1_9CLOT